MVHSNRRQVHWVLVAVEIFLAVLAIGTAYLAEVGDWPTFLTISCIALVLYAGLKIYAAIPEARELLVREDIAAQMATSGINLGLTHFFDMQSAQGQTARNDATQAAIAPARFMWLCANSGASYLDPSIYRHWHSIEKRLQCGIDLRVVLLDPRSPEKLLRNRLNVDGEHLDSKINVGNLIKLYNQYPTVDIRFAKNGMNVTVFATEDCLFLDPYHVGIKDHRIDNRTFCLKIEPTGSDGGSGLYRTFKSHFDTLWTIGTPFEEWLRAANADEAARLPSLKPRDKALS